ncbi:molybdopterin-dependent oxidoreductase [Clostridium sp. Cult3]|uniref:molybdopterin-dependent oxidoreductase n=1 Tax=Clostridium sp. Cult3 TaxID=2079004 RepID=UPI001F2883EC|nr:molybdopterin-dependent oxidoreductase [Clostridium sp. Cult3]MCF6461605.1 hypothetical protein [Clostridium sp. Cult3]
MKKFKNINLFIIILLVISISLSGCGSKKEEKEDIVNIEREQETMNEETDEQEITEEESHMEEETEEEKEEQEEEVEEKDDTVEKAPQKSNTSSAKKETAKSSEKEKTEETANTLKIEGNVGNKLSLSLNELKAMENIIFSGEYYSINNFGTTNHTKFKGVNLWALLEQKAKVSSAATKVSIVAIDGYKMEFTIEQVKRQDYIDETNPDIKLPIIIAWEENGEEYDSEEGPPFKLVVGQKEAGDVNKPQWVSNIDKIIVE